MLHIVVLYRYEKSYRGEGMTIWPEGRMEFVCTAPAEEGEREEKWLGEVVVKNHSMFMAELLIYGRYSCINAVIGKYMSGQYICIPDIV